MHDNSATMNPCITPGPMAPVPGTAGATPAAAWARPLLTAALWASLAMGTSALAQPSAKPRMADYIVAVVNQESVTAFEVRQRAQRLRAEAQRTGAPLPPGDQLEREVLDSLIDERAILSQAREGGIRVDDGDVDRALANIAAQNQMPQIGRAHV